MTAAKISHANRLPSHVLTASMSRGIGSKAFIKTYTAPT
jgi:hypothetical protein